MGTRLPGEQPPSAEEPSRLTEWLSRMMILINAALNTVFDMDSLPSVPPKAIEGMVRYFDEAKLPEISHQGVWVFTNGVWYPLNDAPLLDKKVVQYDEWLDAKSFDEQLPVGTDNPLQISFGPALLNEYVDLDADGTLTFKTTRAADMTLNMSFHRAAANLTAYLIVYATIDGFVSDATFLKTLPGNGEYETKSFSVSVETIPGEVIKFFIFRGSEGADDGGLYPLTLIYPQLAAIPSASLVLGGYDLLTGPGS